MNDRAAETDLHIAAPPETPLADALEQWRADAELGSVDTGRYRCRYFVWGDGPPLVFIHGLGDRAVSFVPMIEPLRRQFRCVSYELPDGQTDGARLGSYRHDHLVDELFILLDHLHLRQAYLFGSSFGSTIALAAMLRDAVRLPRCALQGGFAWRRMSRLEQILCRFLRYAPGPLGGLPFRRYLQPWKEHAVFLRQRKPELWAFLVENSNAISKAAAARRGLMIELIDLRPRLHDIRQPVLLISGEGDSIVPESCDQQLMEGLPNVARVEIPASGHYPQYTHAGLTAELVRQFLSEPSCGLASRAEREIC